MKIFYRISISISYDTQNIENEKVNISRNATTRFKPNISTNDLLTSDNIDDNQNCLIVVSHKFNV